MEIRYVAGVSAADDKSLLVSVVGLVEEDGVRLNATMIIPDMTRDQAAHLHMQLGNALGLGAGLTS